MRLHPSWTRRLAQFNRSHPNHPDVAIVWDPKAVSFFRTRGLYGATVREKVYEGRWQVGVLLPRSLPGFEKVMGYLGRGKWLMRLFTWSQKDRVGGDIGYADVDARVFRGLCMMDTTHRNQLRRAEVADAKKEQENRNETRELAYAGASRYAKYDSPTVPVNPKTKASGKWRHRIR